MSKINSKLESMFDELPTGASEQSAKDPDQELLEEADLE